MTAFLDQLGKLKSPKRMAVTLGAQCSGSLPAGLAGMRWFGDGCLLMWIGAALAPEIQRFCELLLADDESRGRPNACPACLASRAPGTPNLGPLFLAGIVFARVIECAQSVGPMQRVPNGSNVCCIRRESVFGNIVNITRLVLFVLLIASCSPNVASVNEADYSAKIIGDWMGTVGDMKEAISFSANGGFVSHLRQQGFISNTLGQGVTGTIGGTWAINGKSITLNITNAEDERVLNKSTTSTIESFKPNELVVKSSADGTSTFVE
jgi:hypothetical protein